MKNSHLLCRVYSYIFFKPLKSSLLLGKFFLFTQKPKHSCSSDKNIIDCLSMDWAPIGASRWPTGCPTSPAWRRPGPHLRRWRRSSRRSGGGGSWSAAGLPDKKETELSNAAKHRAGKTFSSNVGEMLCPIDYFFKINHIHLQDRWRTLHPCKKNSKTLAFFCFYFFENLHYLYAHSMDM